MTRGWTTARRVHQNDGSGAVIAVLSAANAPAEEGGDVGCHGLDVFRVPRTS
jgi:hypothetical protein